MVSCPCGDHRLKEEREDRVTGLKYAYHQLITAIQKTPSIQGSGEEGLATILVVWFWWGEAERFTRKYVHRTSESWWKQPWWRLRQRIRMIIWKDVSTWILKLSPNYLTSEGKIKGSGRFELRLRTHLTFVIQRNKSNLLKYFNHKVMHSLLDHMYFVHYSWSLGLKVTRVWIFSLSSAFACTTWSLIAV